jgi:hypothetical protein
VFGGVVVIGLLLGWAHLVTRPAYLAATIILLAGLALGWRRQPGAPSGTSPVPAIALGFWIAIVAFVIGMGVSNSPFTAYDAVSYHLFFPARWLQAHRLLIVPTPFSDEAQAYQPGNGELWFLWLMVPLHGDLLARIGQVPFYLLGAAATYLLALRAGASRVHALYAPTLFMLAPPIVEQAVGANVDLIAASMFVCALWLSLAAIDSDAGADWALWGCALGLFVGTKYLAVVYAPLLVLVAMMRGPRVRMLWALPGILALGAPWYLRNWIVAGSPLYPATLTVAGITLGRGAYTHAAMLQSFMHSTDDRVLAVSLIHAFGTNFFLLIAPALVGAAVVKIRRRDWWPAVALFAAVVGVVVLCWMSVGDDTDARFLLPAVAAAPALVPLAFGGRRADRFLHAWLAAGMAWVLIGADRQLTAGVPWFMSDWLPLRGLVEHGFVVTFAVLAAGGAALCAVVARWRLAGATAVVLTLAAGVTLAVGAEHWCLPGRCDYVQIDSPHFKSSYIFAARWLTDHARDANVAYTGNNLPYPLSGSDLANRVYYVNIDNHLSWRFDQYAAAYRRGELVDPPAPLARPSGVLMPANGPDAVRPRYERRAGDPDEWKMNLRREHIGYLFVTTLDGYESDYVWHDAQGFPIENDWASRDTEAFRLAFSNDVVRIYEVNLPMADTAR